MLHLLSQSERHSRKPSVLIGHTQPQPSPLSEQTFDELVKLMADHYSPAPSEIVQRFKFNTRQRQRGESVASYIAELRAIAKHCNSGAVLEDML